MTDNKFEVYLKRYIWIVAGAFLFVGIINAVVDPYNEFGINKIGFYARVERQAKKNIDKYPHDAVLIGTSKTAHINPDNLCKYEFYNASFSGALPEEIYYYLKKYVHKEKFVALGLDFTMFNENNKPLRKLSEWPRFENNILEYLFSVDVFKTSVLGLYKHSKGVDPVIWPNGWRDSSDANQRDKTSKDYEYEAVLELLRTENFHDFKLSEARLEYLRKTAALLKERKIPYVVFVNPLNVEVLDLFKDVGVYEQFIQWKKEVAHIFDHFEDLSEGQYSERQFFYKADPFHYKQKIGAEFVNSFLNCDQK